MYYPRCDDIQHTPSTHLDYVETAKNNSAKSCLPNAASRYDGVIGIIDRFEIRLCHSVANIKGEYCVELGDNSLATINTMISKSEPTNTSPFY